MPFNIQNMPHKEPQTIEKISLQTIEQKYQKYNKINSFSYEEKEIIKRMLHASPCFELIIPNILFTKNSINKAKKILTNNGIIITDTNMIKTGISQIYTEKYQNQIICYVNNPEIQKKAKLLNITRSYLATEKAINKYKNKPLILACGNAPSAIYSAINTIITKKIPLNNILFITFPVGFVNVIDSKKYMQSFINYHNNANAIILKGQFGGSTLVVSCIHAIYKLIN